MYSEIVNISVPVSKDVALVYFNSDKYEKLKIQALFSILIKENIDVHKKKLLTIMDDISEEAKKNGLTESILAEILNSND
jgi:hypothetical protein